MGQKRWLREYDDEPEEVAKGGGIPLWVWIGGGATFALPAGALRPPASSFLLDSSPTAAYHRRLGFGAGTAPPSQRRLAVPVLSGTAMLMKAIARVLVQKSVGQVLVKAAGNALAFGVGGDLIVEMWKLWDDYRQESQQKRKEVEDIAKLPDAEAHRQAVEVVDQEAAGQPESVRRAITDYLTQIPKSIRNSQRRPQDPSGRSLSALLSLRRPEDLGAILPPRFPRFKVGDRPPGIGDWKLEELLGMGGFGEVWKARNPYMPDSVALKFCLDPDAAKALRNEAVLLGRVASQGQNPRIVRLRNTYLSADPPCLEYEYVAGGDLAGLAYQQMQKHQGKMPPDLARKIIRNLARAMSHPHRLKPPIVHRDLKPANILVQPAAGGTVTFRIADFGIGGVAASRAIEEARGANTSHFQTTALRGAHTPLYASPQQAAGADPDPRDDVYALGVIWYQLLVGDLSKPAPHGVGWMRPFREQGVAAAELDLLQSCFEDEPECRPAGAGELAQHIEELDKKPLTTPSLPPPSQFAEDMREALEELRTRGDTRGYFERQGPVRFGAWKAAAEGGNAAAQWLLSRCLHFGAGAAQDTEAGLTWLQRAAQAGVPVAQTDLGDRYYLGEEVDADTTEAFRLYTAAAAQGFPEAQVDLGDCYWEGKGVTQDFAEAVRHYRMGAEASWARGQDSLGDCYYDGSGVEQDYPQAIGWYRRAAGQGLANAQNNLGWCYQSGKGVRKNWDEAVKLYRQAAEQGHDGAQFCLGSCYQYGRGVEPDLAQAEQWYRRAADQGYRKARNALARLQADAEPGPDDSPEAEYEGGADATGYWVIAPYSAEPLEEWQRVWEFDLANGVISIGWAELGDISSLDEQHLRAAIERAYPDPETSAQARGQYFGMLWNFFHEIKVGDVVIARLGRKKIAAVGTVTRTAYHDPHKTRRVVGDWYTYGNHIEVKWADSPRDKNFDRQVFGMQTVYRIAEEKYRTLLGKPISERWLTVLRLLAKKGATSPAGAVQFSSFRVEAKAAGGIMYGYDNISDAGLIEWLKRGSESGWFLCLTPAGRAALEAPSDNGHDASTQTKEGETPAETVPGG